ncbi:XRE family transcriptional regulator [Vibrio cincinnatiensis]|nr:helix-turn-helix domain-containing protein [Vibrio cincinnatiensis]MCG3723303.1 XRE family transcriptional regulator [Vibrio cincinnatiensis]MCG3727161.1 XRE family transcriptional regulator [Vibrio cincinnatiensis]MCG3734692.1 XRE family transcriptional regulator [Vibrio cincinnatiensis]MCG3736615.1 XRE family transcriptional regulator [Vibrio cincinnatiensis]MCG3741781.1 XRE family transcriptional regulator [Vibrio cincinnatiensis]
MEFNAEDRQALYNVWMSQKAKMHLTQMAMAKRLGLSQLEFSQRLRGELPLSASFVTQFCQHLHVEPYHVIPSMKKVPKFSSRTIQLQNKIIIDGDIQQVRVEGNQVVIEYLHHLEQ